jgi:hypothetical protein
MISPPIRMRFQCIFGPIGHIATIGYTGKESAKKTLTSLKKGTLCFLNNLPGLPGLPGPKIVKMSFLPIEETTFQEGDREVIEFREEQTQPFFFQGG